MAVNLEKELRRLQAQTRKDQLRIVQAEDQVAELERKCVWKRNNNYEDYDIWETQCDNTWEFTADGPKENNCKFCMYCGGALIIEETNHED